MNETLNKELEVTHHSINRQILLILIAFIGIIGIISSAGYIGVSSLQKNNHHFQTVINTNSEKIKQLYIMASAVRERMLSVYDIVHTDDLFEREDLFIKAGIQIQDFLQAREKLVSLGITTEQKIQLDEQRQLLKQAQIILNKVIAEALEEEDIKSLAQIHNAREANEKVLISLTEMQNSQRQNAQYEFNFAEKNTKEAIERVIFLAILALALSSLIILFIIQQMRQQNSALNDVLSELKETNDTLEYQVQKRTTALMNAKANNIRMATELELGQHLQEVIVPNKKELIQNPHLDISAFIKPADEMGGDYYDVLHVNQSTYIGIGDVTGHGLESGIIMLMAQSAIRSHFAGKHIQIKSILSKINKTLFDNLQRMGTSKHLSLILLEHYIKEGKGHLNICGQHETCLILRTSGEIEEIETDKLGFPIGLIEVIEMYINVKEVILNQGDIIVLYTDGITEAENIKNEFYGVQRLKKSLQQHKNKPVESIKKAVVEDVNAFIGKQRVYDDMTLMIIKELA